MRYFIKLTLLITGLTILSNCNTDKTYENKNLELKKQNDSLINILNLIKNKYVFDSISIQQRSNEKNTKKINSTYESDFFVVGFGLNNLDFTKYDSISYNPLKLYNKSTLENSEGIYKLKMKLDKKLNSFNIRMTLNSDYGKSQNTTIKGTVKASN